MISYLLMLLEFSVESWTLDSLVFAAKLRIVQQITLDIFMLRGKLERQDVLVKNVNKTANLHATQMISTWISRV